MPMRILHIINTLAFGGAQSVLVHLLEAWEDKQDIHRVISFGSKEPLSGRIEALNIVVEYIDFQPNKFEPWKFLKFVKIINDYKPDITQTWLYHADLIGSIASQLVSHAPIIWGIHHTTTDKSSVKSSTWIIIRLLAQLSRFLPSCIICCSHSAYQAHLNLGYPKNKMTVIVNGIDTTQFRPDSNARGVVRDELGLSPQTILIGMFARFHPQKDHKTFIRAAGILLKQNPDVHFVLAGNEIDNSNKLLMDELSREDILKNFHLLGNRLDMPRLQAGMDIGTLSSAYGEALSMTLCEAMSCGIPCVATNIGDSALLIGDAGLTVEPNNPDALAHAWMTILGYSNIEYNHLGNKARQRILKIYNRLQMVSEYNRVYQRQSHFDEIY